MNENFGEEFTFSKRFALKIIKRRRLILARKRDVYVKLGEKMGVCNAIGTLGKHEEISFVTLQIELCNLRTICGLDVADNVKIKAFLIIVTKHSSTLQSNGSCT